MGLVTVAGSRDSRQSDLLDQRRWRPALSVAVLAVAVLLSSCADDPPAAADCDVSTVDDARLGACDDIDGEADLPDLTLPCLGSDTEASLAHIGGPAVVNFWGSWCGPCREEMPVIESFHQKYGDQVAVVGVAIDTYPEAAAEFAVEKGVTYPSLLDGCGSIEETELALGRGLPQTIFVAEDGSIVRHGGAFESVSDLVELAEDNLGIELARSAA
jgi:thiol-disulfide isomerase/thioredoxin